MVKNKHNIYFEEAELFPDILDYIITRIIITIWTFLIDKIEAYE